MTAATEWWTPGAGRGTGGDTPVIRHSAAADQYCYPDAKLAEVMGTGFACIPAGNSDGTSKGFSADQAGVIHVDPEQPDHGVIIDVARLSPQALSAAVQQARDPYEAYCRLGVQVDPGVVGPPPPRPTTNSRMPGTYLTPPAPEGRAPAYPVSESSMPQPGQPFAPPTLRNRPAPAAVVPPSAAPVYAAPPPPAPPPGYEPAYAYDPAPPGPPAYAPPPPAYAYPGPPAADPTMLHLLERMNQTMATLATRLDPPPPPPRLTPPLAGEPPAGWGGPAAAAEPPQTLRDYQASQDDEAGDRLIVGFETLRIGFINGPLGTKPKVSVTFELEDGTSFASRFHDVLDEPRCVVLVYDTRYEDGTQFLPPVSVTRKLTVAFAAGKTQKSYRVGSLGLTYSHGVLDYILLVKEGNDGEPD